MDEINKDISQVLLELEKIKQENFRLQTECAELREELNEIKGEKTSKTPDMENIVEMPIHDAEAFIEDNYRKILNDYLRMYAERDDDLTKYFSDNFSGFTGGGDFLVKSKDEWIAITRQDFSQVKESLNLEIKDISIQKLSETVFAATSFFTIHLPIKDHILSRETARLVLIYCKEAQGWKIVHSGISIPYHLVRDGEVYPMAELEKRNRFLEELVAERTLQLTEANLNLHKINRELAAKVSEQALAKEALRQSNKKLEAILSASHDGIGILSKSGEIRFMSDKVSELFGYPAGYNHEVVGKSAFEFIDPSFHGYLTENIKKLLSGEDKTGITEYLAVKKDGTRFYIEINSTILRDSEGVPDGILFVERDISERKKAEVLIQKQNKELSELNATKDKFFSIIAHDLRSPFQGFIGITHIMAEEIDNFPRERLISLAKEINESAVNLHKLLLNLLDWARMQEGNISFKPTRITASQIAVYKNDLIVKKGRQKGIDIGFNIPDDISIHADEVMFNSIIRNLISNAVKFTKPGGKITVSVKKTGNNMAEFSVEDTGIGMSEDLCKKLFKMNEKVGTTGTDGELSTGLGLLLCKEFITKNGGTIRVESRENKGSTFYFLLPCF